jgi:glycosyltransferase involved in cell wall biosynthesis
MRIAFYAPLKPPDHPVPSGDRRVARLLIEALRAAGHEVSLASRFRSRDRGDGVRQQRLEQLGWRLAERFVTRAAPRPDLWFTYHLYDKAPDWIGPWVAAALGIPYVAAEASVAWRRANGPWALGHEAVAAALRRAALVVHLNSADRAGVERAAGPRPALLLKPFLDAAPFATARAARAATRSRLAADHDLPAATPWLIAVGMMRDGDKLASYRLLAESVARLHDRPWRLLVVGDGPSRAAVERALAPLGRRAVLLGAQDEASVAALLAASDLFVWPAINEAFGMALLEAQAAGIPVVAGRIGGVPDIVAHEATGLLTETGAAALAEAVATLLDDPERRCGMGKAALAKITAEHTLDAAARRLDRALASLVRRDAAE